MSHLFLKPQYTAVIVFLVVVVVFKLEVEPTIVLQWEINYLYS